MSYLIAIAVTFLLLSGFLVFAGIESRRGTRVLRGPRTRFDRVVSRISFVVGHIDWGGFFAHLLKSTFERVLHDVVHFTLVAVRATERTLTRAIRTLRERVAHRTQEKLPDEGAPLISTLIRFRKQSKKEPAPQSETGAEVRDSG